MIVGVVSLLLALTFGGVDYAWSSWQIISLFVIAVISLISFGFIEKRAKEPILPIHLFKNRTFTTLSGIGFFMSVGMFGAITFVPLFMQGIVGVSATSSGTIMTPMMIALVIASIIGGQLVQKIGVKPQIIMGMIIMATGFGLLLTLSQNTTQHSAMLNMMVIGLGIGFVMPTITLALQESFSKEELGVVTSSSQFFRQIGGTFGMTILGTIMNQRSGQLLTDNLLPKLQAIPHGANTMVEQFKSMILTNPSSLYSALFDPKTLANMPASMKEMLVPTLKDSLMNSLHTVFLCAVFIVLVGAVLALFLTNIKLSNRKAKKRAS